MKGSVAALITLAVLGGCSGDNPDEVASSVASESLPATSLASEARMRVEAVQDSLDDWRDAGTLTDAQTAADRTRLLITGPDVTGLQPVTAGGVDTGLLPGGEGEPGIASAVADCAGPDLLGGSWDNPDQRWATLRDAIAAWSPDNNTFPALPSHAQRVVGWATLTLRADGLVEAREYSGHAQLHVDASRDALAACR